ncbi:c-type cytochrome biogenesis protein CcmI [Bartonella sp. HY406]|uniref:c-type cytochrome biogenesis protein CcmI n=1 Tax=Bartonella sp. HY406 TaxID=2979331 RepID=UPI0021C6D36E|nr:c-type cytochrome biogenesis protein CcmI [Bartonella sp. HY406]UXN04693.1 c-type cytochrome biogenesis protein CcmI [Bartonella sp. HY406]
MFFWFILILITISVVFLLVRALGRDAILSKSKSEDNAQSDIAVYKSQLIEIDEEEADGQISHENAKEARLELARRILSSEKTPIKNGLNTTNGSKDHGMKTIVFIGILFIIAGSWGIYSLMGSPDMPQRPFEILMSKDDSTLDLAEKIVKSEALLARNPDQGDLLDKLGDLYLETGRFRDAANMFNRSLGVNGESSKRFLSYGIALMGLENGVVNKDAEIALQQAAKLDPENPQPQIFLARGLIQNGEQQQAIELLEKFVNDHGKGQAWVADMQLVIDQLKGIEPQAPTKLTKEQHDFIANNVGKLEDKLQESPQDLQGWLMLINAYFLLEQPEKVRSTYEKALRLLSPENREKLINTLQDKGFSPSHAKEAH